MEKYTKIKQICKTTGFNDIIIIKRNIDELVFVLKRISLDEQKTNGIDPLNQVKLLQSLQHPNIIKIEDSFIHQNKLCIVMQYADEGDLKLKVKKVLEKEEYIPENDIMNWFSQLCLAMKTLFDNNILHRDIKIQNIFLSQDGLIKLGDFGISKRLDNTGDLAQTSLGTPYYLSPEICKASQYDHKTDIWMLGCTLYELCSLQQPFTGESLHMVIQQIINEKHSQIPEHYSETIKYLVDWMLNQNPEDRPTINDIIGLEDIQNELEKIKQAYPEAYQNFDFPTVTSGKSVKIRKTIPKQINLVLNDISGESDQQTDPGSTSNSNNVQSFRKQNININTPKDGDSSPSYREGPASKQDKLAQNSIQALLQKARQNSLSPISNNNHESQKQNNFSMKPIRVEQSSPETFSQIQLEEELHHVEALKEANNFQHRKTPESVYEQSLNAPNHLVINPNQNQNQNPEYKFSFLANNTELGNNQAFNGPEEMIETPKLANFQNQFSFQESDRLGDLIKEGQKNSNIQQQQVPPPIASHRVNNYFQNPPNLTISINNLVNQSEFSGNNKKSDSTSQIPEVNDNPEESNVISDIEIDQAEYTAKQNTQLQYQQVTAQQEEREIQRPHSQKFSDLKGERSKVKMNILLNSESKGDQGPNFGTISESAELTPNEENRQDNFKAVQNYMGGVKQHSSASSNNSTPVSSSGYGIGHGSSNNQAQNNLETPKILNKTNINLVNVQSILTPSMAQITHKLEEKKVVNDLIFEELTGMKPISAGGASTSSSHNNGPSKNKPYFREISINTQGLDPHYSGDQKSTSTPSDILNTQYSDNNEGGIENGTSQVGSDLLLNSLSNQSGNMGATGGIGSSSTGYIQGGQSNGGYGNLNSNGNNMNYGPSSTGASSTSNQMGGGQNSSSIKKKSNSQSQMGSSISSSSGTSGLLSSVGGSNQMTNSGAISNSGGQNIPTTKAKPRTFNFENIFNPSKCPSSPNRTILFSDFLRRKLGEEKFAKMKELLQNSKNPMKLLDENRSAISEIIGQENLDCIQVFKFLISSSVTPPGNHFRTKSDQLQDLSLKASSSFEETASNNIGGSIGGPLSLTSQVTSPTVQGIDLSTNVNQIKQSFINSAIYNQKVSYAPKFDFIPPTTTTPSTNSHQNFNNSLSINKSGTQSLDIGEQRISNNNININNNNNESLTPNSGGIGTSINKPQQHYQQFIIRAKDNSLKGPVQQGSQETEASQINLYSTSVEANSVQGTTSQAQQSNPLSQITFQDIQLTQEIKSDEN